jgi:predicted phosphodiesterase
MEELVIAVVSDLHCKHSKSEAQNEKATYLYSDLAKKPINKNPIEALKVLILKETVTTKLLLCPGDISDKADSQGLISGWNFLSEIKTALSAKTLIATTGNHDVDSRKMNGNAPFQALKDSINNYPIDDNEDACKSFWADGFCLYTDENYAVLIYNSSQFHTDKDEAAKSEIKATTLEKIEKAIGNLPKGIRYKVALSHHHPLKHSNVTYKDGDVMERGDEFLEILSKHNFQIFIHGHKHEPRLRYNNKLPVFCAGSFSSLMNLADTGARNLFHTIHLKPNEQKGIIKSWEYSPYNGWQLKNDTLFPCITGFGNLENINELAKSCATWFKGNGKEFDYYKNLVDQFPDIQFLIPEDQTKLHELLLKEYSIELIPALPGMPKTISNLMR